jgi:NAD(P)-dependent dehydrogenase (short-subunit alcohol dehydrogenase family)
MSWRCPWFRLGYRRPAGVCDLVGRLEPDYGGIGVLVNNAALHGPSGEAWNTDPDDWQNTFDVNVAGVLGMCRAVIPGMCTRGHGRIVNIVSNAGKHRWPHMSAYSVSKAAVIKLTDQAARNLLLLAAGMADTRSGQYLTVHDDFTAS